MKILGIISCYYTDINDLLTNIQSFINDIDHLIIWENTPTAGSKLASCTELKTHEKIEIRTTGKNEYLAYPFNLCIQWASDNGYTHILTMDQDSRFESDHFRKYIQLIKNYPFPDVAMFAPSSNSRHPVEKSASEVIYTFLSGAVYPVSVFRSLGGFNEQLAIDGIDTDYCLKARKNGYKTIVFKDIFLNHKLGYRSKNKLGLTIVSYSAQRSYYFIRNTFWLWKEYPESFTIQERKRFIKYRVVFRLLKIVFEKKAFKKFMAILIAVYHDKINKSGRYDHF